ncbi:MAG: glycoside hydrolase family 31 protein, partial [Actinobacteria bacterium]|nr:glycoside hydrolase family 31 protein [Actinomycetota bacterium]
MRRLILVGAVVVLAGCGGQRQFRVGGLPVRELGITYRLADGTEHRLTSVRSRRGDVYVVSTDERGRTATVAVERSGGTTRISVQLNPAKGVAEVHDAFAASAHDHFLGGGEHADYVDLRGRIVPVKVSYVCSSAPIPYFASTAGWGLRLATENVAGLAFPESSGGSGCTFDSSPECTFPPLKDRVEVCVLGARLDEDVYAGSPAAVLRAYEDDVGAPRVPPRSELELVKWRDVVNRPSDLIEDVTKLRAAGVPIGWVLLDNPWEPCVGTLRFDTRRIPDPAALVRTLHALGVKFMLWVSPKDICVNYPADDLVGPRGHQVVALWRPAAARLFESRLRRVFAIGVDGVKGDRGDEVELGSRQNAYPLLFARAVLSALKPGAAGIFRAATVGSQSVLPGMWAGDQSGDFVGLQAAIRDGVSAGMSGFPTWGSDTGGYSTSPTAEVFARWAQFSAMTPVFEVGGTGANATPWTLGAGAMSALRDAAVLHYELFPYLYGLLEGHEPVLRSLGYAFPADEAAWQADFEFMVGSDLLAAPVVGPGTTPRVYLPRGSWIDLYTGATVEGPANFVRPTPLSQFPLYVRPGAVVPFDMRTASSWWGADELTHPGRAGYLVTAGAAV